MPTAEQRTSIDRLVDQWESEKSIDLVCEGGGVLGIGLVGAYSVLEARGFHVEHAAGTSAGAIVTTLIAAGYSANAIHDIIRDLPFDRIRDPEWPIAVFGNGAVPQIGAELLFHGLNKGKFFLDYITDLLAKKNVKVFGDLLADDAESKNSPYRYKANVIVSDLTTHSMLVLPGGAKEAFDIDPDDLDVAEAVRMSMSIPLFFAPVRKMNHGEHREHILVDGGMLSNFPVWFFDSSGPPRWPTLGIRLVAPDPDRDGGFVQLLPGALQASDVGRFVGFIEALVNTMTRAHDRQYLQSDVYVRTIPVPIGNVSGTDFGLDAATRAALFSAGENAAVVFLDQRWDYRSYLLAFRPELHKADPPPRHEVLGEYMRQMT